MISLAELNIAEEATFVAQLSGIFEHSPWVAEQVLADRPFASLEALHAAMLSVVSSSGEERQISLLRAHPELAGQEAVQGSMTAHSTLEQGGSGLLQCSSDELIRLQDLNRAYGEKFGFPFIIAVRGLSRAAIIGEFSRRLQLGRETEMAEALKQIARITGLRLAASVIDQADAEPA